jgi:superfamily II DNA or RNA helicase
MALRDRLSIVRSAKTTGLRAVVDASAFGFVSYTTASLPDRVFTGLDAARRPPSVLHGEADIDVEHVQTPLDYLLAPTGSGAAWPTETKRSLRRFEAAWLLTEDRFRLLDASPVEPLAHQASLVEHILASPDLQRVLIADEVGLGKTVEAGLIIKRLSDRKTGTLRVLYLTEARLVRNVIEEFERLGLRPREWSAQAESAILDPDNSDPLVIASMHRAVVNMDKVGASGPWDMIIVDEAHHLSDWSVDGSDPQQRMRLCRRLISERLVPDGRVLLLSGTPHQGSQDKFKNLLRLLDGEGKASGARGKVIYRIKDDIQDWSGQPLFPKRRVNVPIQIDAGPDYTVWMEKVHELLTPYSGSRAAGWRRAQALQWCASSPQAGLAYLVRLALRAGMTRRSMRIIDDAMASLRPYRGGTATEPIEAVEARLMKAQELMGEDAEEVFQDPRRGLQDVLELGVELVRSDALGCKLDKVFELLDAHQNEKFVVFAQPVDTVYTLKQRFERHLGPKAVSLIVGNQQPAERQAEISHFREGSRRVLVSSRSGGEGINLQIARRLIHFDVPWNPMEMEQRVGRIHRYGSTDTVVVDTLVLKDSREQRVLARSRARLGKIASDLDQDRVEVLFSRTMSLIPLDELAALMAGENFGPLTPADEERIDRLITEGYRDWTARDKEFRAKTEQLRGVDRGVVSERAYRDFLIGALSAKPLSGWSALQFRNGKNGQEPTLVESEAEVLELPDGTIGYVGRSPGIGLHTGNGSKGQPVPIGLNHPTVASRIRELMGEGEYTKAAEIPRGAGVLRIPKAEWTALLEGLSVPKIAAEGGILLGYHRRLLDLGTAMQELSTDIHCWLVNSDASEGVMVTSDVVAQIVRLARNAGAKITTPTGLSSDALCEFERERLAELGRDTAEKPFIGIFPLLALWMEPVNIKAGELD